MKSRWTKFGSLPLFVWQLFFLAVPLTFVILYSILQKGPYGGVVYQFNFENYMRAFDGIYFSIFVSSLRIAFGSSLMCLLVGFPIAWYMSKSSKRIRNILLVALMLPFLTNCVIRACAIKIILGPDGPHNYLMSFLGFGNEPIILTDTLLAVWIGMVTNYLPFLVLPIYVSLEKIDFSLLEAASDLGARPHQVFVRVLLPLVKPGLVTGFMLVFIPALCEFLIPDFLGGAKNMLLGGLIAEQFLKARDWPFGSALSMILLLAVLGFSLIQQQMSSQRKAKA